MYVRYASLTNIIKKKYSLMKEKRRVGHWVESSVIAGASYQAFIPYPLPPHPAIELSGSYDLLDEANVALGRLEGVSEALPDASLLLYMYIRKEAVLSSQIEGTQSSLSDLLLYENHQAPGVPLHDVEEVSCYVSAMQYGLSRLETLPLSLRLLREIHAKLMCHSRGRHQQPGEFRHSQNWLGGTRPGNAHFVPPPPDQLMACLADFETFLHDEKVALPFLVKVALAHVQFETIHPFLDGNGRLGRLLITLMLCAQGVLSKPLLYLSLYFKTHRQAYYDHLQSVRETGDWESWIAFFLTGVTATANQAADTAQYLVQLCADDRYRIEVSDQATPAVFKIHHYLQHHPISNTAMIRKETHLSQPTVMRGLRALEILGMVKEISGRERHKTFIYKSYLDVLNQA